MTSQHQADSSVPKVVNMSLGLPNNACCPPINDPAGVNNAVINAIGNGISRSNMSTKQGRPLEKHFHSARYYFVSALIKWDRRPILIC